MHRRAVESDIVIVNHHLFFADLALRQTGAPDAGILPEFSAVIFDEAHDLEDVASSYFGVSVSNLRFEELARDIENTLQQKQAMSAGLHQSLARMRDAPASSLACCRKAMDVSPSILVKLFWKRTAKITTPPCNRWDASSPNWSCYRKNPTRYLGLPCALRNCKRNSHSSWNRTTRTRPSGSSIAENARHVLASSIRSFRPRRLMSRKF